MESRQLQNILLVLVIISVSFACNQSATVPDTGTAVVEGRIESSEGTHNKASAVEGAKVTAVRVAADGSLEVFDNDAETETDANGEFSLNIDVETIGEASGKIIILAEGENQQWKAILAGELEDGANILLKPLNDETTGEAEVFQQVVANGETDLVTKADIELFVGNQPGNEIKGNTEAAAEFADAFAAEAEARSRLFANQSVQITGQQNTEIRNSKNEALAELHSGLYTSNSESARIEAYNIFIQTVANAHTNAEVNSTAYCKAKEGATHLILKNVSEISSNARSEVRGNTAFLVSIVVDNAVQARMESVNAAESSVESAAQAGIQLRSEFEVNTAATLNEIESAFETYNEAILEILKKEFSASAEIIVSINNEINRTAGIKAALETTVDASTNTDLIVQAYSTFYSGVRSVVDDIFPTANQTEAEFITDVMIMINLAN